MERGIVRDEESRRDEPRARWPRASTRNRNAADRESAASSRIAACRRLARAPAHSAKRDERRRRCTSLRSASARAPRAARPRAPTVGGVGRRDRTNRPRPSARSAKPSSSGSVIGVLCRYSTFGLSRMSAARPRPRGDRSPTCDDDGARAPARPQRQGADRDRDRRAAGAIRPVALHGQQVEEVRQRQPDGADLPPARREAVDDAARDDQMRARVVVTERQILRARRRAAAAARERGPRQKTSARRPRARQPSRTLGYNRRVARSRGMAPSILDASSPRLPSQRFASPSRHSPRHTVRPASRSSPFLDSSFLSLPEVTDCADRVLRRAASAPAGSSTRS